MAARVRELREELSKVDSYRWLKAQAIYDEITALCNATGPSGGMMCPRACKYCQYYGHSSMHCKRRQAVMDAKEAAEWRALQLHRYVPPTEDQVTPAHWQWIQELKVINDKVADALSKGLGCDECGARGICRGCKQWVAHMEQPVNGLVVSA